jgi:predicted cobalt transporter CbtA
MGLTLTMMIYGVAVGGIFALVFALLHGRVGRWSARPMAAALALCGFLAVFLVPFLKYPANPPGASVDTTISSRTGLYLVLVLISVALAGGSLLLARRVASRWGAWNAGILATVAYVAVVGAVAIAMPVVDETPPGFPALALYEFRVASVGVQLVLWAALGLAFGALVDRRAPATSGADNYRPSAG